MNNCQREVFFKSLVQEGKKELMFGSNLSVFWFIDGKYYENAKCGNGEFTEVSFERVTLIALISHQEQFLLEFLEKHSGITAPTYKYLNKA